ncbi:MAG: glycosyltransferase family 2 protein [Nitrososphaerales archaeon]
MVSINPKVSVIIVNYNGALFLDKLFSSLQTQTFKDFEVIFVDNASTDNSLEIVRSFAKKKDLDVKIVDLPNNYGFCRGSNIGFKYAKGMYIALLNNDTYVSQNWLEELVRTMDSDASIGICQSKIIDLRNKRTVYGNFLGVYGKRKIGKHFKITDSLFEEAFYASGTALMIRRDLVEIMGYLFDDRQFTGDMDLSWRARLMGFRVVTNLRSICYHYQGHSSRMVLRNDVDVEYVVFKDQLRTFIKNYGLAHLFLRIPILLFIDFLNSIYAFIKTGSPVIYALLRAILWNLYDLRGIWKDHIKTQTKRRIQDGEIENYMLPYPAELYFFRLNYGKERRLDYLGTSKFWSERQIFEKQLHFS